LTKVFDGELLEVLLAMKTGIDDRDAPVDALEHQIIHRDVQTPRWIGASANQARDAKAN
jgi:hypothetical protein